MGVLYFFMGKPYHVFIYLFMHYDEFYISYVSFFGQGFYPDKDI